MTSPHDKAWSDFWAQNRNSGQSGGCLPEKWQGIDAVQKEFWRKFAADIPRKARVLDVATGDGRVMAWMLARRRDLKLTGVDMAPVLPEPPRGTKIRADVLMENMPFPNKRFAAATSQFGFEYGSIAQTAAEIARIVEPGGRIGLMTHRQDGPILEHNLKRRKQIGWAIDEQELIVLAKKSLALRAAGLTSLPPKLTAAPAEGARLFGPTSAAWEIAEAIRQTLVMGARDHAANVSQLLDTIAGHARNEIGRINSLEAACAQTADDTAFNVAVKKGGLSQQSINPVLEHGTSRPFADFRVLTHS